AEKYSLSRLAGPYGPAADRGWGGPAATALHPFRTGPASHYLADIFVAERDRQLHPAIGEAHLLAPAEIKPAVRQVQVAVADAGGKNLQENFAAGRLRRGLFIGVQRLGANADLEHAHRTFSRIYRQEQRTTVRGLRHYRAN